MRIGIETSKGFVGMVFEGDDAPEQAIQGQIETAAAETPQASFMSWEQMLGAPNPEESTVLSAAGALKTSAWAYRAVSEIIRAIIAVPLIFEQRSNEGEYIRVDDAPPAELFENVNSADTKKDLFAWLIGSLELYGGVPFEKEFNLAGFPIHLWPMHMQATKVIPHATERIAGFNYSINGKQIRLKREQVLYIKYWHPTDLLYGLPPFQAALRAIEIDYHAQNMNRRIFKRGGIIDGVLETDQSITGTKANELTKRLKDKLRRDEIPIMSEGLTYKPLTPTLADMLFKEMREFNREEIGSAFGVPPAMMGVNKYANYANFEAQKRSFYESTVQPKLEWIIAALNAWLMPDFGVVTGARGTPVALYRARFDTSDLKYLHEDPNERTERQALQIASSQKTVNEIRVQNGDEPYADPRYDQPTGGGQIVIERESDDGEGNKKESKGVYDFGKRQTAALPAGEPYFDPVEQMTPILVPAVDLYSDLTDAMLKFVQAEGRLDRLRTIAGSLDDDAAPAYNRRRIDEAVEAIFLPFDWHEQQAERIRADFVGAYERVYTAGARMGEAKILKALNRSYLISPEQSRFELVNQHIRYSLDARAQFWIDQGLGETYEQAKSTFVTEYFDKYKSFSDAQLVSSIQRTFNYTATWEAQRTARTETHIIGQRAQQRMFDASGVEGRGWRHSGNANGRPAHIALHEKEINLTSGERFSVGAYSAVGPGDPSLGVEELANCGCDSYPVIIMAEGINLWDGS